MCVYGALAQLVVRYIRIVEVTGSTPVCSTFCLDGFIFTGMEPFFSIFTNKKLPPYPSVQ